MPADEGPGPLRVVPILLSGQQLHRFVPASRTGAVPPSIFRSRVMNKAIAVIVLGALGLIPWSGVVGADERAEIAAGVASCVNAAMTQGHRTEAFSVAYCQCVIPKIVHSMPANLRQAATKEQAESFSMRW